MNESVFISYNHADKEYALAVEAFLSKNDVPVIRDDKDALVGQSIEQFIEENVRKNQFVLLLVSQKSLDSSWVSMEIVETLLALKFQPGKMLIPCCLDQSFLDDGLMNQLIGRIDEELKSHQKKHSDLSKKKVETVHLDDKIDRLSALRYNLPRIFKHLQTHKTVNIATPDFEGGMAEVLKAISKATPSELVIAYAKWMIRRHSTIPVPGLRGASEIELNRVFVSLRGELSKNYEVRISNERFLEAVKIIERNAMLSVLEKERQKSHVLGRSAIMPSIEERDMAGRGNTLNLAEALKCHDRLIILGDPGMGKTTLARWLALKFATALAQGEERVLVPADQISTEGQSGDWIDLGVARLPILIRVGEMSPRLNKEAKYEDIVGFLGEQTWLGHRPSLDMAGQQLIEAADLRKLMLGYLQKGKALLIFDGLDEIIEESARHNTVNAIQSFLMEVEKQVQSVSPYQSNKVIVTSRIAGYHTCPLYLSDSVHATIQPMEEAPIRSFCKTWVKAAHHQATPSDKTLEVEFSAREIAKGLIDTIFDSAHSRIQVLAGNPMLLTELSKIYYTDRKFPAIRAELYNKAACNMLTQWRNRSRVPVQEQAFFERKVFFVFADIAEKIHEEYPSGLMVKGEIENLIGKSLADFYQENRDITRIPDLEVEKRIFLKTLNEEIGILAARGADYYGFLHLTFEEFFAAQKLLRQLDKDTGIILDKAYRPRWREPLLLALGELRTQSEESRQDVLRRLVELHESDAMGNLVPQAASLIVQALPEMGFMPDNKLMKDIFLQLFRAYSGKVGESKDVEVLRTSIDDAIQPLLKVDHLRSRFEQTLIEVLKKEEYGADLKNSATLLILQNKIFKKSIAEALLTVRPYDAAEWQWPIHRALQEIGHSQPDWLNNRQLFKLRVYLKEHPEAISTIEESWDWLKIITLLYGGLVLGEEKPDASYRFSSEGIYRDSCLTDPIIQLLESKESPKSLSKQCDAVWQDEKRPLADRVDCLLFFLLFQTTLTPKAKAIASAIGHPLREAVLVRLDMVRTLLNPVLVFMIRKANTGMKTVLPEIGGEANARQLMFRMLHLPLAFRESMLGDPLIWIESVPQELKPTIMAEFWVRSFFAEDSAYSFAVVFDTAGGRLEKLGPEVIARSFAIANQATIQPPSEKWRLERLPFEPNDWDDIIDAALLHLTALAPEFNMLKYWAFNQIFPLIESRPHLFAKTFFLFKTMEDSTYLLDCLKIMFGDPGSSKQFSDEDLEKNIESDFSKVPFYMLSSPGQKNTHLKILATSRKLDKAHHALQILSNYRTQGYSFTQDNTGKANPLWKLFDHSLLLVEKLRNPESQVRGYLKLASFCERTAPFSWVNFFSAFQNRKRKRRWLLRAAIRASGQIKDPFVLAECLREIKSWTIDDPGLQKHLSVRYARIKDANARAVLEDRFVPAFSALPKVIAQSAFVPFAITSLSAFLRDMSMSFGLPLTTEGLWEQLNTQPIAQIEPIVGRLSELGKPAPLRLTLAATLGFGRLIQQSRFDLLDRLMPAVGLPVQESVPIISEWLDVENPRLQSFSALLLLESGILTPKSFPYLKLILFGEVMGRQDQFRNRANMALNPPDRRFFASKIGVECLEMVEQAQEKYEEEAPYLVRALSWIDSYLVYDDSDVIRHFIRLVKNPGLRADTAHHFLHGVHRLSAPSFEAFLEGLRDHNPRVRTALLHATIFVLHHNSLRFEQNIALLGYLRTEILQAAQAEDPVIQKYALEAIGYLPDLNEDERQILLRQTEGGRAMALIALGRADFEQSKSRIESFIGDGGPELRRAAAECLCRQIIPADVLLKPSELKHYLQRVETELNLPSADILTALLDAGQNLWYDNYYKNFMVLMGAFFENHEKLFEEFIPKALGCIRFNRDFRGEPDYDKRNEWKNQMVHLDALASGAVKLPEIFRYTVEKMLGADEASKLFLSIVQQSTVFTDRINALICLSCLRAMNEYASTAFCTAMKDIAEVQTTAIKSIWRFEDIDTDFIQTIAEKLDSESLGACYAMIGMLKSIGVHPKTGTNVRQKILEVLKSKLESPIFQDEVYLLEKRVNKFRKQDGTEEETEEGINQIRHCGRLDHEIYRAILDVAGIRAKKSDL